MKKTICLNLPLDLYVLLIDLGFLMGATTDTDAIKKVILSYYALDHEHLVSKYVYEHDNIISNGVRVHFSEEDLDNELYKNRVKKCPELYKSCECQAVLLDPPTDHEPLIKCHL